MGQKKGGQPELRDLSLHSKPRRGLQKTTQFRLSPFFNLSRIPGVGPSIAADLFLLGIRDVAELRGRNPEALYAEMCEKAGQQDRCLLYVFRCAVYYASTARPEPELLKWWNWKDGAPAAAGVRPVKARKSRIR
jgi:hypothetical protein